MFDIGAAELLLVAIVALVVIGPKDLPGALRGVGRVMGQLRNLTGQFRFSLDSMIREAEMEEREKEWAQKNADIMAQHPPDETDADPDPDQPGAEMKPLKPIATDEAGEISSREGTAPQASPESVSSTEEDSSQIDLFGGKA